MHFTKRGPFGNLFKQTKANEGFSIDIPISTEALNEAGCFFAKVQGENGQALMSLRLNYGSSFASLSPHTYSGEDEEIKCLELDRPWRWGTGDNQGPLYTSAANSLAWTQIIGLHCGKTYID
jgi:hypothetical protein